MLCTSADMMMLCTSADMADLETPIQLNRQPPPTGCAERTGATYADGGRGRRNGHPRP